MKNERIDITQYSVKNEKIKPKKLLLISDTHSRPCYKVNEIINQENIDAILIAGDVIDDKPSKDSYDEILEWLTDIATKVPVFCCLGNHETRRTEIPLTKIMLEKTGVKVLDNMLTRFDDLLIYGYTSDSGDNKLLFPPERDNVILMCHMPMDFVKYFKDLNLFLTVSGHEHGGQWRFFNRGVYSPSQGIFPKYTKGLLFNNRLIISRGTSNPSSIPRINNNPEVIIININ